MLIIYKVVVAVAGTPGPILGDGVKTTVTVHVPSAAGNSLSISNSLGSSTSVMNQSTRQAFRIARVQIVALNGNTGKCFFGGAGQVAANMVPLDPASAFPQIGNGYTAEVSLGDLDVDATTSGDGFLVIAEVL